MRNWFKEQHNIINLIGSLDSHDTESQSSVRTPSTISTVAEEDESTYFALQPRTSSISFNQISSNIQSSITSSFRNIEAYDTQLTSSAGFDPSIYKLVSSTIIDNDSTLVNTNPVILFNFIK